MISRDNDTGAAYDVDGASISDTSVCSWRVLDLLGSPLSFPASLLQNVCPHVDLWCCQTEELPSGTLRDTRLLELLSPEERKQHADLRFQPHRELYLATHLLARTVLSQYVDIPPEQWQFWKDRWGKPHISLETKVPRGAGELFFNLSRSGSLAVCGVSHTAPLGVDVEDGARDLDAGELAHYILNPVELSDFLRTPETQRKALLLRYWSLKEAFARAVGLGLTLEPNSISFGGISGGTQPSLRFSGGFGETHLWHFRSLLLFNRYLAAIAIGPA